MSEGPWHLGEQGLPRAARLGSWGEVGEPQGMKLKPGGHILRGLYLGGDGEPMEGFLWGRKAIRLGF